MRAEVEDYDSESDRYRVDCRSDWVSASKVKKDDTEGRERKRQKTAGGDFNAGSVDCRNAEGLPSGSTTGSVAGRDAGSGPHSVAEGLSSASATSGPSTAQHLVPASVGGLAPPQDSGSGLVAFVINFIEILKSIGSPWDAMQATFATSQDVLTATLTAARAQVPFLHGEAGICYQGFQSCP